MALFENPPEPPAHQDEPALPALFVWLLLACVMVASALLAHDTDPSSAPLLLPEHALDAAVAAGGG